MAPVRCLICDKDVAPRAANRAFPFCSPRCKRVDLGKWLGEEYRVSEKEGEREDEVPDTSDSGTFDA